MACAHKLGKCHFPHKPFIQKMPSEHHHDSKSARSLAKGELPAQGPQTWLKENRPALEAYNEHVEKDGVFSEGLRSF